MSEQTPIEAAGDTRSIEQKVADELDLDIAFLKAAEVPEKELTKAFNGIHHTGRDCLISLGIAAAAFAVCSATRESESLVALLSFVTCALDLLGPLVPLSRGDRLRQEIKHLANEHFDAERFRAYTEKKSTAAPSATPT